MNKDCCHPQKNGQVKKNGIDPFLAGIIIVTLLLLGGVVYFGAKAGAVSQVSTNNQVELTVGDKTFDWGTIDINNGIVSKSFTIENKGSVPLKLYNVKTSCMCTTAQLKTQDQTSKKFGMHEKSNDVFEVKPSKTAELIVEFDPAFHGPSGIGPINRTVTLNTNDANNPTLSFQLTANVVKK